MGQHRAESHEASAEPPPETRRPGSEQAPGPSSAGHVEDLARERVAYVVINDTDF